MNIPILYEDNHLFIVEKPVNIPVQEDASKDKDLLTMLKQFIKKRDNKPGNVYLALVHRLDRPVGGAIIFAKTSKAASRLANLLRKREIERTYLAVVRGIVQNRGETLTNYLLKDNRRNQVSIVHNNKRGAQKAILHYKLLERYERDQLSLLRVTLETGRSHQVRVQLKGMGHPLYGDQRYGADVNKVGEQIALWSHEVSFIHPVRQTKVTITSQPPNEYPWNLR